MEPSQGKPTPTRYLPLSFKVGAVSPHTVQTQRPVRASLFSGAGRGLTPVQVSCPVREGKPSARLENQALRLFSFFFSIFSQKGDVGLLTIFSYSFPRKETPSTMIHSAHGLTCDYEGSDSTSVHPSQGRQGARPWAGFHNHLLWSPGMSAQQTLDH